MEREKSCFISYAWDAESRIKQFIKCLAACLNANGISPLVDIQCNSDVGSNIDSFIQNTMVVNYIIVVVTNQYIKKIRNRHTKVYIEWCNIQKRIGSDCIILPVLYDLDCQLPTEIRHLCSVEVNPSGIKNLISQISDTDVSQHSIEKIFSEFDLWKYDFMQPNFTKAALQQTAEQYAKSLLPEIAWKIRDATTGIISDGDIEIIDASEQQLVKPYVPLESVCLEGYFQKELRILVIATNGYIAPKFKYKLWSAYKDRGKTIIFIDKNDIVFLQKSALARNSVPCETDRIDDEYSIITCNYLSLPEYIDLNAQILCPKDFYEVLYQYTDCFAVSENMTEGKIYFLHLYVFSTTHQTLQIIKENELPFTIIKFTNDPYLIHLEKGFNNVYFQIMAQRIGNYTNQVLYFKKIMTDSYKEVRICSFRIERSMTPLITFKKQTDIFLKINTLIQEDSRCSKFITVLGNSGCGKSYIISKLKEELLCSKKDDLFRLLSIQFVSNNDTTNKNNILLSDLLFFLYSGLPFETNMEWLTNSDISRIILPHTLHKLIVNLRKPDGDLAIIESLKEFENDSADVIDRQTYFDKKKIVFIDDIQKLSPLSAKILQFIVHFFHTQELSVTFVLSGRILELEHYDAAFIDTSCKFEIENMDLDDIKESILKTGTIDKSIVEASTLDRSFCNTVFYVRKLLSHLCGQNYNNVGAFNFELKRENIEIRQGSTYIKHLIKRLTDIERSYINIICACRKFGLCVYNSHYFESDILIELEFRQYIVLQNDEILVGHDIYYESIEVEYNEMLANYLVLQYKRTQDERIRNNILSLLILCDFKDSSRFLKEAYERVCKYFMTTEFSMILNLAESMIQCMDSAGRNDLSIEQRAEITLIYANALNHYGNTTKAYLYFSKVNTYKEMGNIVVDSLIFEADTEKINLDYWHLRTESIYEDLKKLRSETAACLCYDLYTILKAYLNTFNREMVTHLLLDKYEDASTLFNTYLNECKIHKNEEYAGFAYMDYAKGIYNENKIDALAYLKKAHQIFEKTGQIRRKLDCQCEIAFINAILKNGDKESMDTLVAASNRLKENGLIAQYKKSVIKIAAIRLKNDLRYAARLMSDFNIYTLYDIEKLPPRSKLIISNLDIVQRKVTEKPPFCDIVELLQLQIGRSYLEIIEHNLRVSICPDTTVQFVDGKCDYDDSTFLIDTRIW